MTEYIDMNPKCLLSLCIPTNGITEWVIPVMHSILGQNVDEDLYEIVISDNGNSDEFRLQIEKLMQAHTNIQYFKSSASGFLNQIDCFHRARGQLIKFVNHRMTLREGTVDYLLDISRKYAASAPVIYFTDNKLKLASEEQSFQSFDAFVRTLSYYSSWSAGIALWKSQLNRFESVHRFNKTFPHIDILFVDSESDHYIIFDKKVMDELQTDESKKGKYNLFLAFGVEYPRIILTLFTEGKISFDTYRYVIGQNGKFLAYLYMRYIIRRDPCSYLFDNLKEYCDVFYSHRFIRLHGWIKYLKGIPGTRMEKKG